MKKTLYLIALCLCICSIANAQTDNVSRKRTTTTQKSNPVQKSNQKNDSHTPVKNSSASKTGKVQSSSSSVSQPTGFVNGHGFVDLGLSVKWATMNVGATSPGDYGGYYAWAETKTKANYGKNNCFDCNYISGSDFTHNIYKRGGQNKITITSGHDTAQENWGGTWRLPTDVELDELNKNCKWTFTTQNGHNGCKITGPNGNSIFLPACGEMNGGESLYLGECGDYWSNTLWTDGFSASSHCANKLHFYKNNNRQIQNGWRCYGCCIRPVTD